MIRKCIDSETEIIYAIINDAAKAYENVIPSDRWKKPYMEMDELKEQIEDGVVFYCDEQDNEVLGVMGIQDKGDVILIRHAYVRTKNRKAGTGTKLLKYLTDGQPKPILIGAWKDADWAINFYLKNGFKLAKEEEKNVLLKKYWRIPERQVETSVVLMDEKYSQMEPSLK